MLDPLTPPRYAGFWKRFNAYGIDATLVLILTYLAGMFLGGTATAQDADDMKTLTDAIQALQTGQMDPQLVQTAQSGVVRSLLGGSFLPGADEYVALVISAFYNIFFIGSDWQATPGKRWCGIIVTMKDGRRLTLLESAIRHAVSGLSMLAFGLGYITMFFTPDKLALHDIICNTRVVFGKKP